jgi:hypothetical protein
MIAVAQRGAADGAFHGVERLNARFAFMRQAGALHIGAQFVGQRLVDLLCLIRVWSRIRVLDAGAGNFEHVVQTGARIGAHVQEDSIDKAQPVKAQYGWIDPTVDRDIRGIERGRFADGSGAVGIAGDLASAVGSTGLFSREGIAGYEEKPCQHCREVDNRSHGRRSAHVHLPTLSFGCAGSMHENSLLGCWTGSAAGCALD